MDCLEHVEDDKTLFNELVELVRPGGTLIVTVPAMMALYGERDERIGHYRRYERDELAALAEDAPIDVHQLRFWNALGVGPTYRLRNSSSAMSTKAFGMAHRICVSV